MRWFTGGFLLALMISYPQGNPQACEFHPVPSFDKGLVKVEPFGTSGLVGFYYDLDGDGIPDRALLFQVGADGGFVRWPLLYAEGLDATGLADEVWEDSQGDGKCGDLRLYWKRML